MSNAQVRVKLIHHARGHCLYVAGYRYMAKNRKQDRDASSAGNAQKKTVHAP